ncbi:unnamed protein product [Cyprideis torosa]|uniref:Nitrilase and fragile histidine triad fusion protein NitFhit n=1 Tax=Cyprideis torosa TaxID=163714 RepID=A0A7R8WCT8_9CRUS|nr:unnamed protein product [Cyprideis torosa]CAG0893770.1 unnamed protein product [Cyprideis torosa]
MAVPCIGVVQMCSSGDIEENFQKCKSYILGAKDKGAEMVFLPECFDFVGRSKEETLRLSDALDGALIERFRDLARTAGVWLSLGGFHERVSEEDNSKIYNSHVLISASGDIKAVYRKCHLFDVDLPEKGVVLKESSYVKRGEEIVSPVETPIGKVGLGICYDLRFPAFSTSLCLSEGTGAQILTYPSTFTVPTGKAHWEVLLRARAIENQAFVVAAAQVGQHNEKRRSFGHALILDPWGRILAQAGGSDPELLMAKIDLNELKKRRIEMPVRSHRRADLYGDPLLPLTSGIRFPGDDEEFPWGERIKLKGSTVFCRTPFSMAFVNRKCVLPGHVLVSPLRFVRRLFDLSRQETSDLFTLVQRVQRVMERVHDTPNSTIAIQDGKHAGQSIEHLHVHIIPRKATDFGGHQDQLYEQLAAHDKKEHIEWRSEKEMVEECRMLRKYFEEGSF